MPMNGWDAPQIRFCSAKARANTSRAAHGQRRATQSSFARNRRPARLRSVLWGKARDRLGLRQLDHGLDSDQAPIELAHLARQLLHRFGEGLDLVLLS